MRCVLAALVPLAVSSVACAPDILVGAASGSDASIAPVDLDASAVSDDGALAPLVVPWSTGFEKGFVNGFSDWLDQGYCYMQGGGSFAIVNSPVHAGLYAAQFTVDPMNGLTSEARCLRQGVLPAAAYYGAWYFVPGSAISSGNWNLLHWQGASGPGAPVHNLWDISLLNEPDGSLDTSTFDFLRVRSIDNGSAIPIDAWFHIEVFLQRSAGDAGALTVFRDGVAVLQLAGLSTDDSAWGQWHVGNLATALFPAVSTVYVDDVTIGTTPSAP